jgi:hypothetical protein
MQTQLTPEQRKQRIETIVKVLAVGGLCLILGPVYLTLLHGMAAIVALGVFSVIGFVVINLIPAFARLVGNWRLKALKAVAAANPIESLENVYKQKQEALAASHDNITQTYAILSGLHDQIVEHDQQFPGKPSQYLEKYNKLSQLVDLRKRKYQQARANLAQFDEIIQEKRSDWKIAQTMAQANKLANVGEDFESKLMQDTALSTVQDGLNTAFAELDTALMDAEPIPGATVTVSPAVTPKAITNSPTAALPVLDLDGPSVTDAEVVPAKSSRRNKININ